MQSRGSRKARRRYRLYAVIAVLTVIAGLSGFYMGWELFIAITSHRTAAIDRHTGGATGGGETAPPATAPPATNPPATNPPNAGVVAGSVTFTPAAVTVYSFQDAAVDRVRLAQAEVSRLTAKGYPAYVIRLASSPPPYKVRVGAFRDKTVAGAYAASLKKAGLKGFVASLSIAATPRTWRGSDKAYLERLKRALDEAAGLIAAEGAWYDAYYQKKIDHPGLTELFEPWADRLGQATADLGAAKAPPDLAPLADLAGKALRDAESNLQALAGLADSGSGEAYAKSVSTYMAAIEGLLGVLAWAGPSGG